jgi:hypothetical protein
MYQPDLAAGAQRGAGSRKNQVLSYSDCYCIVPEKALSGKKVLPAARQATFCGGELLDQNIIINWQTAMCT